MGETSIEFMFNSGLDLRDLLCITFNITELNEQAQKENSRDARKKQVWKCREMLFTQTYLMCSPCLDKTNHIWVTVKETDFRLGKMNKMLQKLKLQIVALEPMNAKIVQSCAQYTITARLAPLWNEAGTWLIKGREFLASTSKMTAASLQVSVQDLDMKLRMKAAMMVIPCVQPDDLGISALKAKQFSEGKIKEIQYFHIKRQWKHVLPSLKKGQVKSVTRFIPKNSQFKDYAELKKYWKNSYGYRLPEIEERFLFFYNVHFIALGNQLFTYPLWCLRSSEPTFFYRVNASAILQSLLDDLANKVGGLCGSAFNFSHCVNYPSVDLPSARVQDSIKEEETAEMPKWKPLPKTQENKKKERALEPWISGAIKQEEEASTDDCKRWGNQGVTDIPNGSLGSSNPQKQALPQATARHFLDKPHQQQKKLTDWYQIQKKINEKSALIKSFGASTGERKFRESVSQKRKPPNLDRLKKSKMASLTGAAPVGQATRANPNASKKRTKSEKGSLKKEFDVFDKLSQTSSKTAGSRMPMLTQPDVVFTAGKIAAQGVVGVATRERQQEDNYTIVGNEGVTDTSDASLRFSNHQKQTVTQADVENFLNKRNLQQEDLVDSCHIQKNIHEEAALVKSFGASDWEIRFRYYMSQTRETSNVGYLKSIRTGALAEVPVGEETRVNPNGPIKSSNLEDSAGNQLDILEILSKTSRRSASSHMQMQPNVATTAGELTVQGIVGPSARKKQQ